jgi:enamine deaminase RidA (YjgF/YER057c/UK114 family)
MSVPINPESLPDPRGFSHGMLSNGGQILHVAGETGHRADLAIDDDFVAQFSQACRSVVAVVSEAGGAPTDVVSMTIFVTDLTEYRENLQAVGEAYQGVFGKHFPAMALIGVSELVDPAARVEITAVAVLRD